MLEQLAVMLEGIGRLVWIGIGIYLVVINLINFAEMGLDKRKSKKEQWRVPESRFFVLALLGGSLGGWIGMNVFHHKTKHWYFRFGLPAIFFLQIAAVAGLCYVLFLR